LALEVLEVLHAELGLVHTVGLEVVGDTSAVDLTEGVVVCQGAEQDVLETLKAEYSGWEPVCPGFVVHEAHPDLAGNDGLEHNDANEDSSDAALLSLVVLEEVSHVTDADAHDDRRQQTHDRHD